MIGQLYDLCKERTSLKKPVMTIRNKFYEVVTCVGVFFWAGGLFVACNKTVLPFK